MSPEISFVSARYTRSLRNGDSCAHDGWVAPVHNRTVRQATVTSDGFRRACIRRFSWRACDALSRADVKDSLPPISTRGRRNHNSTKWFSLWVSCTEREKGGVKRENRY